MNIQMFNGNNLLLELSSTTRQKVKLRNAFENNMSTDLKFSNNLIWRLFRFIKLAGPLMKVAVPLAKNILALLGITAAASAIGTGIHQKIHGSGNTTLIISNEEMNDIWKTFQALEDPNILLEGVTKPIKIKQKNKKKYF